MSSTEGGTKSGKIKLSFRPLGVDAINSRKGVERMAEIDKRLVYGKLHIYPASRSVYKND